MTTRSVIRVVGALAGATLCAAANATVLVNETFSYPNGNLVPNNGWNAHSGAGNLPVQVLAGQAVLAQGAGSREDVNIPFTAIGAGQTIYAGFDFTNTGASTDLYFAHFLQGTSNFRARVWLTAPTAGGDYTLGFSDGTTIASTWGTDLTFGQSYRIVIAYDFDTKENRLWINPVTELSTNLSATGSTSLAVAAFALRQATPTTGTPSQTIDNLLVATSFAEVVPAPGSAALLGLGLIVAGRRRR